VRVLLTCLHFGLLRNFESVITELAARGHEVVLASEERDRFGGDDIAESLRTQHGVRLEDVPPALDEAAVDLGQRVRLVLDYLRFQSPEFQEFTKLRERAPERLPYFATRLDVNRIPGGRRLLVALERALPDSAGLGEWLDVVRPEVVLFASLTHSRSTQPALLRAAIQRRIPSIACIYSWDHLSSKSHIIDVPDRVLVWNDTQKAEAVRLHGLPADRIEATGAQCYDHWFESRPSQSRDEFCRAVGLDPAHPFVLYTCSALTPRPNEPAYVMEFIARLRQSDRPALRSLGVLIRPHPERVSEWDGIDHRQWPNVVFKPRSGPPDVARRDYTDALHHSAAVIGVVTSAFLDAAIVGRPVLTPMLPMFAPHQWGAQHFRYLLEVEDGLPIVGRSLDEHLAQLERVLTGGDDWAARQQRFLNAFIRAGRMDCAATPRFADAVEAVGRRPSTAFRRRAGAIARAAAPLALALAQRPKARSWLLDPSERENDVRKVWEELNRRSKESVRDARYEAKEQDRRQRELLKQQQREQKERAKRARLRARRLQRAREELNLLGQRIAGRVRRALGRPAS
jgi:hypothetical protein